MNRIVLGLDAKHRYEAAMRLLARLRFGDTSVDLFHAVEMPLLFGDATMPINGQVLIDAMEQIKDAGRELCTATAGKLPEVGLDIGEIKVADGFPAAEIMNYADHVGARLIAVGSTRKGPLRAFLTGSIGRSLVIGAHQSVLIAKEDPCPTGPIRAVFATDHSAYADQCIEQLLTLAPHGISHLTVLTCYPKEFVHAIRPFLPDFASDPAEWIEANLRERNERVVKTLSPIGCPTESRVASDTPTSVIPTIMRETEADLLILGAQGHGFVERMTLGSTSFHQVMSEPYPVLVLRLPPSQVSGSAS